MKFLEFLGIWKSCDNCNGTGKKNGVKCWVCKGEGGIDTSKI